MSAVTLSVYSQDVNFNKFEWESQWLAAVRRGDVNWQTGTIAPVLRTSLGTAEERCHVPVVWRRDATIAELSGMSPKTYRKRRDELAAAGFLFEIASGHGSRRTIKVLKLPTWSKVEALQIARDALAAYCERTGNDRMGWVDDALCYALRNRETQATATYKGERIEQTGSPPGANGKPSPLPPYIHQKDSDNTVRGSLTGPQSADLTHQPPPSDPKKSPANTPSVIDLERLKRLRAVLISLFAEVGRMLDEGAATHLAQRYGRQGATAETLPGTLELKLVRLVGDGYSTGKIAAILAEDAPTWSPPAPTSPPTNRPTDRPRTTTDDDAHAAFWSRQSELAALHGTDFETIRAELVDEFGDDHPCLC